MLVCHRDTLEPEAAVTPEPVGSNAAASSSRPMPCRPGVRAARGRRARLTRVLVSIGAALVLASCVRAAEKLHDPDIRILWTNDTHGYLSPNYHREEGDDAYVERAPREGRLGGMAYIASLVKRQRAERPDRTVLVDSGDTWHGTIVPLRLNGRPMLEVMNAIGYDAMTPGNVEFIYPQSVLSGLIRDAKFPILAANFYDTEFEDRVKLANLYPYIVRKVGNLKVGIIGMTYHWNIRAVAPANVEGWSFGLREN